ncbi:hypothetical protein [Burkholderia sp. F1]|uniref:hypothetical protein n=1 Tax=Burkholderia sp. F1 TaxID=3366817 RepID=UPI003D734D6F
MANPTNFELMDSAWKIHNIVKTLHAALPDDAFDCDVPTRCMLRHVLELAEPLALELQRRDGEVCHA